MKAVVYDKKGLPEKLIYRDVEKPVPDDNEVLIKIVAVSANAADYRRYLGEGHAQGKVVINVE